MTCKRCQLYTEGRRGGANTREDDVRRQCKPCKFCGGNMGGLCQCLKLTGSCKLCGRRTLCTNRTGVCWRCRREVRCVCGKVVATRRCRDCAAAELEARRARAASAGGADLEAVVRKGREWWPDGLVKAHAGRIRAYQERAARNLPLFG